MKTVSSQSGLVRFLKSFFANFSLIVAGLGLIALGVGYFYSNAKVITVEKDLEFIKIATAKTSIPFGTRVTEEMFDFKNFPIGYIPLNSITESQVRDLVKQKKFVSGNYLPGEVISGSTLTDEPFITNIVTYPPEIGQEYFYLSASDIEQFPNALEPGDLISIYSLENGKIFQFKKVLSMDSSAVASFNTPSYIVLGLTPDEIGVIMQELSDSKMIRITKHETE